MIKKKKKAAAKPKPAPVAGKLASQSYKIVPVSSLREHPKNPRRGDVGLIRESISNNDFYGAVYVQKSTSMIIAGNHRWKAARAEGLTKIPVIYLDIDDKTALKILLADNRTSDAAEYDDANLLALLQEANLSGGLEGTGYDGADLARLIQDSAPISPEPPQVPSHDEHTKMVHQCPRCHYEWTPQTGKRNGTASAEA